MTAPKRTGRIRSHPNEKNLNELATYPLSGRTGLLTQEIAHRGIHRLGAGAFDVIAMLGLEDICWLECGVLAQ